MPSGRAPPCPSAYVAENGSSPSAVSVSVAYPGPAGSHTASAAAALFPSAQLVPLAGFRAVADAVASMDAMHGVLPIESSLVGAVAETHDLLYERRSRSSPRPCCRSSTAWRRRRRSRWRSPGRALAPDGARPVPRLARADAGSGAFPVPTTAEAAQQAAEDGDPTHVAIVSPRGGRSLRADGARRRHRRPPAFTRFVSVAPYTALDRPRENCAHGVLVRHRAPPGALMRRSSRSRASASTSCGSSHGRCPRRRGSTASTPSSRGIRSNRQCGKHCAEVKAVTRELRVVGVYEGHEEEG